jgi:hypothetical protein
MKKKLLPLLLFVAVINLASFAQINLTATSGTTNASYATLGAAFAKINDGTHQGAITLSLTANTTESSTATLYASGSGSANYSSVQIYPTTSGLSISGNMNWPLIDLNGADNVTIDGRVNATGTSPDMIISNINTGGDSYHFASTLRFVNGASNNLVRYCTLKGSSHDGNSGIICFFTSTTTGNSNNTIDHNQITHAGTDRPYNAIFSNGSNGIPNSNNTISNNNIFDVWNISWTHTYAINLSQNNDGANAYNSAWTISGNSFYQTSEYMLSEYAGQNLVIIYITAYAGTNFTISNNYIGGSQPLCGGLPWTKTYGNNSFGAISLNVGTGTASNIQGNIIKNFNYTNTGSNSWGAIGVGSGDVNIGTTEGNCIGSATGNNSIVFTANGYESTRLTGIHIYGSSIINIRNNVIGSITTDKIDHQYVTDFYGIYLQTNNSGNYTVSDNIIGSASTANSIQALSPATEIWGSGVQKMCGIITEGNASSLPILISNNLIANITNGTTNTDPTVQGWIYGIGIFRSTNIVTGNNIHDLTIANANTSSGPVPNDWRTPSLSAGGIVVSVPGNPAQTISANKIYNISNTYASFTGSVAGVYYWGENTTGLIEKNFIHDLSVSPGSSASIHGIKIAIGITTCSNNVITLGGNTSTSLYGIYEAGVPYQNSHIYFNTVYLGGSPVSGSHNSACLYNAGAISTRDFRNNIFHNARSNNGSSGKHYAMFILYPGGNFNCDYNDYWTTGSGGQTGYYGADKSSIPIVTGVTGNDDNSLALSAGFANAGGITESSYYPSICLPAATGTGVTSDYEGTARTASPEMGAFEMALCDNPTSAGSVTASQSLCEGISPASLNSSSPALGYTDNVEYKWQLSTTSDTTGFTDIASSNSLTYAPGLLSTTTWFRRLARATCRPNWTGAAESNVIEITVNPIPQAPTGSAIQYFCSGVHVADLQASGTGIQWYATDAGGTALSANTALINGNHYYASQTSAGCESDTRLDVTAYIGTGITLTNPTVLNVHGWNYEYLLYSATSGNPDQYSIDYNTVANSAGFADVTNAILTPGYITISIPYGASGCYSAILRVRNSISGCISTSYPIIINVATPLQTTFNITQDIGTTIQLDWTPTAGAISYALQYRVPYGLWNGILAYTNSVKISNLNPGTYYEYRVITYTNTLFSVSQVGNFTPEDLTFTKSQDIGNTCQINWDDLSSWASSYIIQYRPFGSSVWTGSPTSINMHKATNLIPETTYECRIQVYKNGYLWGITRPTTYTTGKVSFTTSQDIGTTLLLSWDNFSPWAALYTVQYRKLNTNSWIGLTSNTNQLKILNLTPDYNYEFCLRIYKNNGNSLSLWGVSPITVIRTCKVDFSTLSDNGNSIEIGWTSFSPWANYYTLQYSLPALTTWIANPVTTGNSAIISPILPEQEYYVRLKVYVGNTLWGITKEQKVSRISSSGKSLSIFDDSESEGVSVYPNPFAAQFQLEIISTEISECSWSLTDMCGRTIMKGNKTLTQRKNVLQIEGSDLAKGIYILNAIINNKKHEFRLIKE